MSVVGIDLGTTNTVVGCARAGKVHVLADETGARLLPSVVSFHPNGEVLVGAAAKARRVIDAKNTIYSHKRLIGRSWGSPEIVQAGRRFAFELREGPGQGPLVHARGQDYTLPEISAFVLKRVRQIAERALGGPVDRAIITVPAHFNELQRASTKVAGRVSGLEVLRILNEPTAAALAYGLGRASRERVAVYDFGGGTFDCTLLDLNGNVFEVLATAGDSFLGGDDIDVLIADRMAEAFLKTHRQDARQDPQMYERLKTTAEELKIALSTAEAHTVLLDDFAHGPGGSTTSFAFTLTRHELDALVTPLVERTVKVTQDALALARLSPSSFDKVILVGGTTRIPLVQSRVEGFFGRSPMDRLNPEEVVAIGAAIQAAALTEGMRRRPIPEPPGVKRPPPGQEHAPAEGASPLAQAGITTAVMPQVELARHLRNDGHDTTEPFTGGFGSIEEPSLDSSPPDVPSFPIAISAAESAAGAAEARSPEPVQRPGGRGPDDARSGGKFGTLELTLPADASASSPALHEVKPGHPVLPKPEPAREPAPPVPSPRAVRLAGPPPPPPPPPPGPVVGPPSPIFGAFSSAPPPTPPGPFEFAPGAFDPRPYVPDAATEDTALQVPVLVDVTPRALVVETVGGYTDTIIPRNSKIPCERTRRFTTGRDMQTTVRVRVAQGESPAFPQNTYLGEVELSGLRPAPRGEVTVAVTFEVDADGTLRVRARDIQTGQEARATIQLIGVADESSVVMMINRFAEQPIAGGSSH